MNKKIRLTSLLFLLVTQIYTQASAQTCPWAKKAGGTNEDFGASVVTDNFGNVYYLGNFYSQTIVIGTTTLHNQPNIAFNYGSEMFLAKYDSCGNFKWAEQAGGTSETRGRRLAVDIAGNVYVAGYSNCDTTTFGTQKLINKAGYNIAFVAKYDASGNALWVQQGSGYDGGAMGYAIATDASSNVYVTGNFSSSYIRFGNDSVRNEYSGNFSVFISKFDSNGNIQWVRNGGGDYDSYGYGIGTDASGNVYVGGTFGGSHIRFGIDSLPLNGYYDIFVVKYNTTGTEQWLRAAGGSDDDEAMGLAADASGNVYITGYIGYSSTVNFGTHPITNTTQSLTMFIAKYDNTGTAQWAKISQGDDYTYNEGYNVTLDASGNPYVIGSYSSDLFNMGAVTLSNNSLLTGGSDTAYDIFVAKYKSNGNLSWARTAGGSNHDFGYGIATGSHNSVYITGEFLSDSISFAGIILTRTSASLAGDGDAFIADNISTSPIVPSICMVTVDTVLSQNNLIVWDKTPYVNYADSFIVYREISTNNYKPIGSVPYSALSLFVDTVRTKYAPNTGDPNAGTYRYKIALRDTSGNYSMMSPYHNTIFITNNSGTFSWPQLYTIENSANPVNSYILMRDDNSTGNFHSVNSVAGTQQSITDPAYSNYQTTAAWRVETQWNISCSPTIIKDPQPMAISLNSSRSNTFRTSGAGIQEYENDLQVKISPNPSEGFYSVTVGNTNIRQFQIEIYDVLGEKIYSSSAFRQTSAVGIDISTYPNGVYFLNVKSELGTSVKKIIKE